MSWNSGWRFAFKNELSHHFPIHPNEDLHLIGAGQPLRGRRFPFGVAEAAGLTIPWESFVVDKFPVAIPKRGPLRLRCHLVVREHAAHVVDRILKNGRGSELVEV